MQRKKQFIEYTESEFLDLLADIIEVNGSEEYQDQLLEHFIQITEHPLGSDLIYYPEKTRSIQQSSPIGTFCQL